MRVLEKQKLVIQQTEAAKQYWYMQYETLKKCIRDKTAQNLPVNMCLGDGEA